MDGFSDMERGLAPRGRGKSSPSSPASLSLFCSTALSQRRGAQIWVQDSKGAPPMEIPSATHPLHLWLPSRLLLHRVSCFRNCCELNCGPCRVVCQHTVLCLHKGQDELALLA